MGFFGSCNVETNRYIVKIEAIPSKVVKKFPRHGKTPVLEMVADQRQKLWLK